jgi:hypothetical protein
MALQCTEFLVTLARIIEKPLPNLLFIQAPAGDNSTFPIGDGGAMHRKKLASLRPDLLSARATSLKRPPTAAKAAAVVEGSAAATTKVVLRAKPRASSLAELDANRAPIQPPGAPVIAEAGAPDPTYTSGQPPTVARRNAQLFFDKGGASATGFRPAHWSYHRQETGDSTREVIITPMAGAAAPEAAILYQTSDDTSVANDECLPTEDSSAESRSPQHECISGASRPGEPPHEIDSACETESISGVAGPQTSAPTLPSPTLLMAEMHPPASPVGPCALRSDEFEERWNSRPLSALDAIAVSRLLEPIHHREQHEDGTPEGAICQLPQEPHPTAAAADGATGEGNHGSHTSQPVLVPDQSTIERISASVPSDERSMSFAAEDADAHAFVQSERAATVAENRSASSYAAESSAGGDAIDDSDMARCSEPAGAGLFPSRRSTAAAETLVSAQSQCANLTSRLQTSTVVADLDAERVRMIESIGAVIEQVLRERSYRTRSTPQDGERAYYRSDTAEPMTSQSLSAELRAAKPAPPARARDRRSLIGMVGLVGIGGLLAYTLFQPPIIVASVIRLVGQLAS